MERYFNNVWYGGMAEDDFNGGNDKVLYSENIDITGNTQFVTLQSKPTLYVDTGTKTANALLAITDTVTNSSVVASFCNDGLIYTDEVTAVYDNSGLGNLGDYPVFVFNGYVYFTDASTSSFKLNRTTIANALSATWTPTLAYKTLSSTNVEYTGVTVGAGEVFIWCGSVIHHMLADGTLTSYTGITGGEEVVGITLMPSYFKIYTENGKILLWDGASDSAEQMGGQLNFPIRKAYQIGGIDYVLSGNSAGGQGLYYMNGLTPVVIARNKYSRLIEKQRFNLTYGQTSLTSYFDTIYGIEDETGITGDEGYKIISFGHDLQGLPNAFSYLLSMNSFGNKITNGLNAILYNNGYLYYSSNDGTNRGTERVSIIPSGTKQPNGIIITTRQVLGNGLLKKVLSNLYIRVGNITSTQYIEVYVSIDGGTFTLKETINAMPLDGIARIKLTGEFRDYSIKLKLFTNGSTSPIVYLPYGLDYEFKNI